MGTGKLLITISLKILIFKNNTDIDYINLATSIYLGLLLRTFIDILLDSIGKNTNNNNHIA